MKKKSKLINQERSITWVNLGIALASIHYGLGFLVGSGEAIYTNGPRGILYALSTAIGLLAMVIIAPFYWTNRDPIWKLMGRYYGNSVEKIVAALSGVWMFGVIASQILGGASSLAIFGLGKIPSLVGITALICLLSLIDMGKLTKIFFYMLITSSAVLLLSLLQIGIHWVPTSLNSLLSTPLKGPSVLEEASGVLLTTVLLTVMGMDFHQFLVKARTKRDSILGPLFGGGILILLSILLLSLIYGSIKNGDTAGITDPRQVIPVILLRFGQSVLPGLGILLALPVVLVSVGSGSGVNKIVAKTILDLKLLPKHIGYKRVVISSGIFTLLLSLLGKSIIDLIVSFYAIYVGSVFVPFIVYLRDKTAKNKPASQTTVKQALVVSTISTALVFLLTLFSDAIPYRPLLILGAGFCSSLIVFAISKIAPKLHA